MPCTLHPYPKYKPYTLASPTGAMHVNTMACFVAPLHISLYLFAAWLQCYMLCSPVHQLQVGTGLALTYVAVAASAHMAPSSVQHPCTASYLPTLAALSYCVATDYRHWVQDFRLSSNP